MLARPLLCAESGSNKLLTVRTERPAPVLDYVETSPDVWPCDSQDQSNSIDGSSFEFCPCSSRFHVSGAEDCAICLETIRPETDGDDSCVKLRCGHQFHLSCVQSLSTCPLCRRPIEGEIAFLTGVAFLQNQSAGSTHDTSSVAIMLADMFAIHTSEPEWTERQYLEGASCHVAGAFIQVLVDPIYDEHTRAGAAECLKTIGSASVEPLSALLACEAGPGTGPNAKCRIIDILVCLLNTADARQRELLLLSLSTTMDFASARGFTDVVSSVAAALEKLGASAACESGCAKRNKLYSKLVSWWRMR